jgi:hypothetical protein
VAVGDLVTVLMRIEGDGWLEQATPPRLLAGADFRTYDPKPVPDFKGPGKAYEQIVVPVSTNAAGIGVSFCFFDPRAGAYRTVTRGPFRLAFHPPESLRPAPPFRPEEALPTGEAESPPDMVGLKPPGRRSREIRKAFEIAARAYADGYFGAAVDSYETLLRDGVRSAELLYNLGNAHLMDGNKALAILSYLRARRIEPGDRDIRLNLEIAAGQAGVIVPRRLQDGAAVVMRDENARFAPFASAVSSFPLPEGSIVEERETFGTWKKVSSGKNRRGWLPAGSLTRIQD